MSNLKPSEERSWEHFYAPGTNEVLSQQMPVGSIWSALIEPAIVKTGDKYDAFVYFGNHIKRSQLIDNVNRWASVLHGMELNAGDEIIIFSPLIPEALYILFAANKSGITAIMPNLAASHEALEKSIDKAQAAFIFDDMEPGLTDILAKPQFRHVVLLSAPMSMPAPIGPVLGCLNWMKTSAIRKRSSKYCTAAQAMKLYGRSSVKIDAPYDENHVAVVFSSGGTTKQGTAKLIGMTDKAMISMFRDALAFNLISNPFSEGKRALSLVPPFVCTGLFALVLAPLFRGMTVYIDPRLDQQHFNEDMLKFRPNITLVSGCLWAGFFADMEQREAAGKKIDLSNFELPIMGGEGCTPEVLEWMDAAAHRMGSPIGIVSGYGMSEAFSVITVDYRPDVINKRDDKLAVSTGYPFPGFTVGIFDENGNELPYGQRGELRCKTDTMMKGYLNNPELTNAIIGDGWIHSGDFAEMSPDGLVYIYGRMHENLTAANGEKVYLFDIANHLRQDKSVKDALVMLIGDYSTPHVGAHIILEKGISETSAQVLQRLSDDLSTWLPEDIKVEGYHLHEGTFKMSPICKVYRAYYSRILDGYVRPENGNLVPVQFE